MPEVKVVMRQYALKKKTVDRVTFVNEAFIEEKFNVSGDAFVKRYGAGRKVTIAGEVKFAVVCGVDKRFDNVVVNVLTQPIHIRPSRY